MGFNSAFKGLRKQYRFFFVNPSNTVSNIIRKLTDEVVAYIYITSTIITILRIL